MNTSVDRKIPLFIAALVIGASAIFVATDASADDGNEISLEECPRVVIDAVNSELRGARIDEVEIIHLDGRTLYIVEAKFDGLDIDLQVSDTGAVVRRTDEVRFAEVPSAVQHALLSLGGEVDDVERVTEGGAVTYHAEIDRTGAADLDVIVSPDGHVVSQRDDLD